MVDDVTEGDGAELAVGTTGYADVYTVCASNGVVIDNSWGADDRVQLPMQSGQLMEGLLQGLQGMKAGGQRIISVPADLALGEAGNLDLGIGANHDLIFVVDLYAVIDPTPPPASTEPTGTSEPTDSTEPVDSTEPSESTEPSPTTEPSATSEPAPTRRPTARPRRLEPTRQRRRRRCARRLLPDAAAAGEPRLWPVDQQRVAGLGPDSRRRWRSSRGLLG